MASNTRILVGEDEWETIGAPGRTGRDGLTLPGGFTFAGVNLHVTAIPIQTVDDVQEAVDGWEAEFNAVQAIDDGAHEVLIVKGQEYLVVLHPWQS